eukprot:15439808-Alexandrium_andersonii.AAC.1
MPVLQFASIRDLPCGKCNIASGVRTWNCVGPGTASNWHPKLPRGAFCAVSRAGSEAAHEKGPRGGPKPR